MLLLYIVSFTNKFIIQLLINLKCLLFFYHSCFMIPPILVKKVCHCKISNFFLLHCQILSQGCWKMTNKRGFHYITSVSASWKCSWGHHWAASGFIFVALCISSGLMILSQRCKKRKYYFYIKSVFDSSKHNISGCVWRRHLLIVAVVYYFNPPPVSSHVMDAA